MSLLHKASKPFLCIHPTQYNCLMLQCQNDTVAVWYQQYLRITSALNAVPPVCRKRVNATLKIASNMLFLTDWVDPNQPETIVVQILVSRRSSFSKCGYKERLECLKASVKCTTICQHWGAWRMNINKSNGPQVKYTFFLTKLRVHFE